MKKNKFFPIVFVILSIILFCFGAEARVIYKDINSISIRTNFTNFDYESIKNDGVPDLSFNSDGSSEDNVYVSANGKYSIDSVEWYDVDIEDFDIAGEPRVIVYLTTNDYPYNTSGTNDYYYRFLNSYSSSTCSISGCTFVSATRLSISSLKVIFRLKGLKGTYNPPTDAYWGNDRGIAIWTPDEVADSHYYDLILYRNQTAIAHIDKYHGTTYNFYGYMDKVGDYMFKVRAVSGTDHQSAYGKRSEYTESGYLTIDANTVYNGTNGYINNNGSNINYGTAGWKLENNRWFFVLPSGQMLRNGWSSWNGGWYYFGEDGSMKTGFITLNNNQYYLDHDGKMQVGWLSINDNYYYFDTTNGDHYGAMCVNTWVTYQGKYFYFGHTGVMLTGWQTINDQYGRASYYYFYPRGSVSGLYGYMATNTTIDGFRIGGDGKWIQY